MNPNDAPKTAASTGIAGSRSAATARQIGFVVLLGGCALDFEIPEMLADALAPYGIVCGTANVRGTEGPRNAEASGLVASHAHRIASHA